MMKHSNEVKARLSAIRKEYLKNNPDKHPWRNKDKFQSKPCQKVKDFLKELNINFIEEFQPNLDGRYFSIDIALPDKMIAIEINGNQHYERNGELKDYYREREDILKRNGWIVYQVHYSACFNLDKWKDFFDKIQFADKKIDFDYFNYSPKNATRFCICGKKLAYKCERCQKCREEYIKNNFVPRKIKEGRENVVTPKLPKIKKEPKIPKIRKNLCICGNVKTFKSKLCQKCNNAREEFHIRKVVRPSKEELEKLVLEMPFTKIAKEFGVSDNSIRKWCKAYGIEIPKFPRGYWLKG